MPEVLASVGYFTITGRHLVGGVDSSDADLVPDLVGANGVLRLTPQLPDGRPVVAVAEGASISVVPVPCRLGDGYIYPPTDGFNVQMTTGQPGVRLIASKQDALQPSNWWWLAEFTPDPGEKWSPFSTYFQAEPGDELTIAQLIMQTPPAGTPATYQQVWYPVAAFPTEPVASGDLPAGFRPGIDILLNTTTNEYAEVY